MPTRLNTQRIIGTLQGAPCNWAMALYDKDVSPTLYFGKSPESNKPLIFFATTWIAPKEATMMAVFSPDLPEHIAVRNMNYLLVFVAAAGAPGLLPRLTDIINGVAEDSETFHYATSGIKNGLRVNLDIDKQRSLTTITIRPCNARVYDTRDE